MQAVTDFSWRHAIPFGIVMFVGTILGWLKRRAGRSLARRGYPELARDLGLSYVPPRYPRGLGSLKGEMRGYRVLVDPDETARVVVRFRGSAPLDLRSYPHWKRLPPGYTSFSFADRTLDRWLSGRLVKQSAEVEPLLDDRFRELLKRVMNLGSELKQFAVDSERLEARFDFGTPPYVPPALVRQLLPLLVELAAHIEAGRGAKRDA
jgi:hypothetical protein